MPFSSLTDPIDLARAEAALEKAWAELKPSLAAESDELERNNLALCTAVRKPSSGAPAFVPARAA